MNLASHLDTLYSKKSHLEDDINAEMLRPMPNFLKITELKRKKMAVKTEISAFEEQKFATS